MPLCDVPEEKLINPIVEKGGVKRKSADRREVADQLRGGERRLVRQRTPSLPPQPSSERRLSDLELSDLAPCSSQIHSTQGDDPARLDELWASLTRPTSPMQSPSLINAPGCSRWLPAGERFSDDGGEELKAAVDLREQHRKRRGDPIKVDNAQEERKFKKHNEAVRKKGKGQLIPYIRVEPRRVGVPEVRLELRVEAGPVCLCSCSAPLPSHGTERLPGRHVCTSASMQTDTHSAEAGFSGKGEERERVQLPVFTSLCVDVLVKPCHGQTRRRRVEREFWSCHENGVSQSEGAQRGESSLPSRAFDPRCPSMYAERGEIARCSLPHTCRCSAKVPIHLQFTHTYA